MFLRIRDPIQAHVQRPWVDLGGDERTRNNIHPSGRTEAFPLKQFQPALKLAVERKTQGGEHAEQGLSATQTLSTPHKLFINRDTQTNNAFIRLSYVEENSLMTRALQLRFPFGQKLPGLGESLVMNLP